MVSWTRYSHRLSLCVVGLGLLLVAPTVWGQEAKPDAAAVAAEAPAAAAAADPNTTEQDSVMSLVLGSGPTGVAFVGVLLVFSLVGVSVAIERAINTRRSKIIPAGFVEDLEKLLGRTDLSPNLFHELCSHWTAPISNILNAGLLRLGRPLTEVEKSMEDAAEREMATLRGGIRPLNVVGSIAPLVGLLGTVVGMIIAFRTASQSGLGKGEMMAKGIYMALVTTAAGLTIAIPALILSALFNSKIEKFFREIDQHLMNTMPCFARMEEATSTEPATASPRNPLFKSSARKTEEAKAL